MFIITGLGNPDRVYQNNRHNVGFLFLDYIVTKYSLSDFKKKGNFLYSKNSYHNAETALIKPITYMNLSGEAISSSLNFFKADKKNVVVIYDDVDLPFGKIRIRESGSSGGHNGLKNIEQHLGTRDYMRVRIGIGGSDETSAIYDLKDYVLSNFSPSDLELLSRDVFPIVDDSLNFILNNNIKEAMNRFNGTANHS